MPCVYKGITHAGWGGGSTEAATPGQAGRRVSIYGPRVYRYIIVLLLCFRTSIWNRLCDWFMLTITENVPAKFYF